MEQLKKYGRLLENQIDVQAKETAQELVADLKKSSPKRTGKYAKGWRIKKSGKTYIVHNATNYQLTHLLEYGHAKRSGGRTGSKVHIRPAEEKAVNSFLNALERMIEE